jgi:hydroxymethylbilane synthase
MPQILKIGSRDSKLALVQSFWVRDRLLAEYPDLKIEILEIKTQGDKILDTALSKIGDKGLFTKELENELLLGNIDLAVHSMKDLPTRLPEGLEIIATTARQDVRDVVCFSPAVTSRGIQSLSGVETIATSSLRRIAQLKAIYPDKNFIDIRGNLQTRFKKLDDPTNNISAIILAGAGLVRLNLLDRIGLYLNPLEVLPAVGQGALGIEIASAREDLKDFLRKPLNSYSDELAVGAERAFLRELEGGCQVPIGAYSLIEADQLTLHGAVISLDGQEKFYDYISGPLSEGVNLGQELGLRLKSRGACKILEQIKLSR